jgi:hypothetical protein
VDRAASRCVRASHVASALLPVAVAEAPARVFLRRVGLATATLRAASDPGVDGGEDALAVFVSCASSTTARRALRERVRGVAAALRVGGAGVGLTDLRAGGDDCVRPAAACAAERRVTARAAICW